MWKKFSDDTRYVNDYVDVLVLRAVPKKSAPSHRRQLTLTYHQRRSQEFDLGG